MASPSLAPSSARGQRRLRGAGRGAAARAPAARRRVRAAVAEVAEAEGATAGAAGAVALAPFHLAIPVFDLEVSRRFYGEVLGCSEGRTSPGSWVGACVPAPPPARARTGPDFGN